MRPFISVPSESPAPTMAVPKPYDLTVVIPVIDEINVLPRVLDAVALQRGIRIQALVADGGSSDGSVELVRQRGVQCVETATGRGRQMNAGAAAAAAPALLFLHADCRFSYDFQLADALSHWVTRCQMRGHNRVAGHFGLRFERSGRGRDRLFRHMERKSVLNRPETFNGDQGLLLSQAYFRQLGGFDERWSFLEDQAIGDAIRDSGEFMTLPGALWTSDRRFEKEGAAARYLLMAVIMCARRTGLDDFFEQAEQVYALPSESEALRLARFLELLTLLGDEQARFWDELADYALDNLWQVFFALDTLLDSRWALAGFDQAVAGRLPRRWLRRPLAIALRQLLRGPVLLALQVHDRSVPPRY